MFCKYDFKTERTRHADECQQAYSDHIFWNGSWMRKPNRDRVHSQRTTNEENRTENKPIPATGFHHTEALSRKPASHDNSNPLDTRPREGPVPTAQRRRTSDCAQHVHGPCRRSKEQPTLSTKNEQKNIGEYDMRTIPLPSTKGKDGPRKSEAVQDGRLYPGYRRGALP